MLSLLCLRTESFARKLTTRCILAKDNRKEHETSKAAKGNLIATRCFNEPRGSCNDGRRRRRKKRCIGLSDERADDNGGESVIKARTNAGGGVRDTMETISFNRNSVEEVTKVK